MRRDVMKILNFGSANLDYVYSLDHIVGEGETEQSEAMNTFAGGKGLNQSVAAARAGAKIYHAGRIGNDGEMLIKTLSESGADTSLIKRENEKNGHALAKMAEEFNYSYYTMRNIIKMSTGKSFVQYVQELRVREAARLIGSTDMSISGITNAVGYENESFFRRKFKEYYGVTPKDYKTEKKVK